MRPIWRVRLGMCVLSAAIAPCGTASAQASLQVPIQFDFLNPGARSLALGGAVAALADDATAAFTNPAGLTLLLKPEISFEGRVRRLESHYLQSGRLSGILTRQGADVTQGGVYGTLIDTHASPSFVSITYPKDQFAVAAYRHELASVNQSFLTSGVFEARPDTGEVRELSLSALRQIDIVSYGVSGAYRFGPTFAVGVGLIIEQFKMTSEFRRYTTQPINAAPDYADDNEVARAQQNGEDAGVGGSVGFLWTANSKVRLGALYRRGPAFAFQTKEGQVTAGLKTTTGTFHVPDTFGVGLMVRMSDDAMVTTEYTHVRYSALKDDFINAQAFATGRAENFVIDDGNEFHVGFEYVLAKIAKTPALRAGLWYDPKHSVEYIPTNANDLYDERFSAYLPPGRNLAHFTFGAGLPVNARLEINGGADVSSRTRVASLSAVVRF